MPKYHGKDGIVYLSTSASGDASPVQGLNAWTLNRNTDTVETTEFGSVNKEYVQGLPDLTGTFGGFYNDAETKLFGAAASDDGCKIYLYPSRNAPSKYACGPAWLDASLNTGVSAAVAVSSNFRANGAWDTSHL